MSGKHSSVIKVYAASGKTYEVSTLLPGEHQYMDRQYLFNYIPQELRGCTHIKTHGNDKLISEDDICLTFEVTADVDIYVLYADKFPVLPNWLVEYARTRMNVTRQDSRPDNLKGYFGVYRKSFNRGLITLHGCSPHRMLAVDWYVETGGENYCMYTIAVMEKN